MHNFCILAIHIIGYIQFETKLILNINKIINHDNVKLHRPISHLRKEKLHEGVLAKHIKNIANEMGVKV